MAVFTGLGSEASPSITFSADTNTGIFSPGADQLAVATGGAGRLFINSTGSVGIGTSAPGTGLAVVSTNTYRGASAVTAAFAPSAISAPVVIGNDGGFPFIGAAQTSTGAEGSLQLRTINTPRIHISSGGLVGIGTTSPGSALEINAAAATSPFIAKINTAEAARIDSGGRLLVGTSTARTNYGAGGSPLIQAEATTANGSQIGIVRNENNNGGPALILGKTRATSVGGTNAVLSGDTLGLLVFEGADGTNLIRAAQISCSVDDTPGADDMPGRLVFSTTGDGNASPTERMRVDSSGNLLVGTTTVVSPATTTNEGSRISPNIIAVSRSSQPPLFLQRTTDNGAIALFYRQTTPVGSISVTTTATAYNTSSDYRLKENVVPLDGAIARLNQLPVHRFNFIADPDTVVDGFIAHEAAAVVPECVTGTKDEMEAIGTLTEWNGKVIGTDVLEPDDLTWGDQVEVSPAVEATYDDEGNELTPAEDAVYETVTRSRTWEQTGERPVYQGIDQAKIVPLLTAALQEAIERIELLEAEVTALKA